MSSLWMRGGRSSATCVRRGRWSTGLPGAVGRAAWVLPASLAMVVGWGVLAVSGEVWAYEQSVSSKGAALHWTSPCISVYWNEDGSEDVADDSDLDAFLWAMDSWSDVACSNASLNFAGLTDATVTNFNEEPRPFNMVIFREESWPYIQRPVAFTSVSYNPTTGVIYDADIEMNGVDYEFTTKPVSGVLKLDIQSTLTHEFGHVLGLDHSADPEATMYAETSAGDSGMRTLEADDEEGLCAVYPLAAHGVCKAVTPEFLDEKSAMSAGGGSGSGGAGCSAMAVGSESADGSPAGMWFTVVVLLLVGLVWRLRVRISRARFVGAGSAPEGGSWRA